MTLYAIDESRRELVATWETGRGALLATVADLGGNVGSPEIRTLVAALSHLSRTLWRCYTHPASAAGSLEENTLGWRRELKRRAFADVVQSVLHPNLPDDDGLIETSPNPVVELPHQIGRLLHEIGDPALSAAVAADIDIELAAVEQAECGDLTGRAVQAVQLTKRDPSPLQVDAADRILAGDPLGDPALFTEIDPTSACVAAAHWLKAAADVVSAISAIPVTEVVAEAHNVEALPFETPMALLEYLEAGYSPTDAVTHLIGDAMAVADGEIANAALLVACMKEAQSLARQSGRKGSDLIDDLFPMRLTSLDPRRPARDMLEDLIFALQGCRFLYYEHAEIVFGETTLDEMDERFWTEVRARAAADRKRLHLSSLQPG